MPCCALYIQPCVLRNFENTKVRRVVGTSLPCPGGTEKRDPPRQSASLPDPPPPCCLQRGKETGTNRDYTWEGKRDEERVLVR